MSNPEDQVDFYLLHKDEPLYRDIYKKLGYVGSDLEQVSLSEVAQEAQSFVKSLQHDEAEYYIQKMYEAMVLRRHKILNEVNESYRNHEEQSAKSTELKEHPSIGDMHHQQRSFYDKQSRYYQKVASLKLKKHRQAREVQENSYLSSQHYRTLKDKTSSLSLSARSAYSYGSRSGRSESASQKKRKSVYNKFREGSEIESELRRAKWNAKMRDARQKVESVYRNLKIYSMEKKMQSEIQNDIVKKNKETVRASIVDDIQKKKQRTLEQMGRFSSNRKQQIQVRDKRLMSQKNIHEERQKGVEEYLRNVVQKKKESMNIQLNQTLEKAEKNKRRLDFIRKQEIEQMSVYKKQREAKANQTKQILESQKKQKNQQMYAAYSKNLGFALTARDQRVQSIKNRRLEQRVKDVLTHKNHRVLERRQNYQTDRVKSRLEKKVAELQKIEQIRDRLVDERRVFFGRTLKKIRIMDRELSSSPPKPSKQLCETLNDLSALYPTRVEG